MYGIATACLCRVARLRNGEPEIITEHCGIHGPGLPADALTSSLPLLTETTKFKLNPIGQVYERLTVLRESFPHRSPDGRPRRRFLCRCMCGQELVVWLEHLRGGNTSSCGCLQRERTSLATTKHGHKRIKGLTTRTYSSWQNMKRRCLDTQNKNYKDYGGRGIKICDRWINSFENFLEDMGEADKGMELDRIDNNGNYEPENCKWSTRIEQNNNKRSNVRILLNGKIVSMKQFAQAHNIPYDRFHDLYRDKKLPIGEILKLERWRDYDAIAERITTPRAIFTRIPLEIPEVDDLYRGRICR